MWAQPTEQKWTWPKCPQLSSPHWREVLHVQPSFGRNFSITWNFAKLNSRNLLQSLLDFTDIKMLLLQSFNGLVSDEASHLLQVFQNPWHLHLLLLPQTRPSINKDTVYAVGAHTDPHTARFSEQIIFQTFLCACVPSSGDKSTWAVTWNFPFQVRNCQKHKANPALAEEQTLHTAGSSAWLETQIKKYSLGKKGSKLAQTWRATQPE